MSKKHYVQMAEYLADRRLATRGQGRREVCRMAVAYAGFAKADNPRFDRERFLSVVGNGDSGRVLEDAQ